MLMHEAQVAAARVRPRGSIRALSKLERHIEGRIPDTRAATIKRLESTIGDLEDQLATVRRRLATEKDDGIYAALREEYKGG